MTSHGMHKVGKSASDSSLQAIFWRTAQTSADDRLISQLADERRSAAAAAARPGRALERIPQAMQTYAKMIQL